MDYDEIKDILKNAKNGHNARCRDLEKLLSKLGFKVTLKKKGHYVITHNCLAGFTSQGFACEHGTNKVKKNYLRNIYKVVCDYEDKLKELEQKQK